MSDQTTITDEEWAAKVERATKRPLAETHITLYDANAQAATAAAIRDERAVRRAAMVKLRTAKPDLSEDELAKAVDKQAAVKRATKDRQAAEQAERDAEITFHLRALEPLAYDNLQIAHPPTDEQEKQGRVFNTETFMPALFSACSVRALTVEQAAAILFGGGNTGDAAGLQNTLRSLNETHHLSLGKGSGSTPS